MAKKPDRSVAPHSIESPGTIPEALKAFAAARTQSVADRVTAAISTIREEIKACDGLYPNNGGRLTAAEVCRRAGVKVVTLHGEKHKHTTRVLVMKFVTSTGGLTRAARQQRSGPVDTMPQARQRLEAIAQAYHTDMLRMIDLEARIRELEVENAALKEDLVLMRSSNVVPIGGRKGR